MSMVNLDDTWELPDPIINHCFNLILPNIPGGGDARRFNVACKTAQLPGSGNVGQLPVELHGHKMQFAGKREFDGTFAFTIVEGVDVYMRRACDAWIDKARGRKSQQGGRRSAYAINAYIEILSGEGGDVIHTEALRKFWLMSFNEIELGDGSGIFEYQCQASFDINEPVSAVGK